MNICLGCLLVEREGEGVRFGSKIKIGDFFCYFGCGESFKRWKYYLVLRLFVSKLNLMLPWDLAIDKTIVHHHPAISINVSAAAAATVEKYTPFETIS